MTAADHQVAAVKKRGRVHTVTCACGASFQSIVSEAMARSYASAHRLQQRNA